MAAPGACSAIQEPQTSVTSLARLQELIPPERLEAWASKVVARLEDARERKESGHSDTRLHFVKGLFKEFEWRGGERL